MSTKTTAEHLRMLQRSLIAAREVSHLLPPLDKVHTEHYEQHIRGMKAGLQLAIDSIKWEILMVEAGERTAAAHAQPE